MTQLVVEGKHVEREDVCRPEASKWVATTSIRLVVHGIHLCMEKGQQERMTRKLSCEGAGPESSMWSERAALPPPATTRSGAATEQLDVQALQSARWSVRCTSH